MPNSPDANVLPMGLMIPARYARSRGISRQTVSELIENGVLQLVDGKQLDAGQADLARQSSPHSPKAATDSGVGRSRAEREKYKARLAKLEYRERAGKLISLIEVQRVISGAAATVRDQLLSLPDRVAPVVASVTDPLQVRNLIRDEMLKALSSLPNEIRAISQRQAS